MHTLVELCLKFKCSGCQVRFCSPGGGTGGQADRGGDWRGGGAGGPAPPAGGPTLRQRVLRSPG